MRWKLLIIASFATALISCGLWSVVVICIFGTARALARSDVLLISSAIIPLGVAAYAGVFVYRHTARRRKTQATFAVIMALLFTCGIYLITAALFVDRLYIPRTYEVRHAR